MQFCYCIVQNFDEGNYDELELGKFWWVKLNFDELDHIQAAGERIWMVKLLKIHQIRQYFPHQNFVLYGVLL